MIEIIGWIATIGTLVSFAVKDMWKLRLINSIASVVWIVYALLKLDYPILVINTSVILMHLYWFYTNRKGLGVGGESIKENFIDSSPNSLESPNNTSASVDSVDRDIDFMYKWIRKNSNK